MTGSALPSEPLASGVPAAGELTVAAYLERWLATRAGGSGT